MRTRDRTQAVRIFSNVVLSFEREWQDLRFTLPKDVAASDFTRSGVVAVSGNKSIKAFTRAQALRFRDALDAKRVAQA